jgi:hypothetical protein
MLGQVSDSYCPTLGHGTFISRCSSLKGHRVFAVLSLTRSSITMRIAISTIVLKAGLGPAGYILGTKRDLCFSPPWSIILQNRFPFSSSRFRCREKHRALFSNRLKCRGLRALMQQFANKIWLVEFTNSSNCIRWKGIAGIIVELH